MRRQTINLGKLCSKLMGGGIKQGKEYVEYWEVAG